MRNPLESWGKSDSAWEADGFKIGEDDLALMQQLIIAGKDHSKFMRQILVSVDITAPDFWWKEEATYKIGTVENSTSTMHKIMSKPFTEDMFTLDSLNEEDAVYHIPVKKAVLGLLNNYRNEYLRTNDKRVWRALIQLLPMSFNYTRTVTLNYEVLRNMYHARKNHKLDEWKYDFCKWVSSLPYARELIMIDKNNDNQK